VDHKRNESAVADVARLSIPVVNKSLVKLRKAEIELAAPL